MVLPPLLRVLAVRRDLLVAVIEVALRLHLVLELTRDWVDRKKAAAFVAAYAPNYTNLRREQEEVHAGLAAGTVTMQSLMED